MFRQHTLWHSTQASSRFTPFFYDPETQRVRKTAKPVAYDDILQRKDVHDRRHTNLMFVSGTGIGIVTPGEEVEGVALCYLYIIDTTLTYARMCYVDS